MRRLVGLLLDSSEQARRGWVIVGLCAWLAIVGTGMVLLASYVKQAGAPVVAPSELTTSSSGKFRLLMFAHPHCPCTAASLGELARVMSRCTDEVDATVYFYRPETQPDNWVAGNLWNTAAAIPGVRTEIDSHGQAAAQFGSTTSGTVLLYDATGRLRFQGGITQGRGHEGDNLGKATVMSIVKGESTHVDHGPVFGCAIRSAAASCPE